VGTSSPATGEGSCTPGDHADGGGAGKAHDVGSEEASVGGWEIVVVAVLLIGYAEVSERLAGSMLTPAIVFVSAGLVLGSAGFDLVGSDLTDGTVRLLAEATLALVLFADASAIDTRALRREAGVPVRLLAVGLPLTILIGAVAATWAFPDLVVGEAIALAVLLAPTDAALGQTVVADTRLPSRLRQGLNVESGLNDGICVPLLMASVALAAVEERPADESSILVTLVEELAIAVSVGAVVALVVVGVLRVADRAGWVSRHWAPVVPLATAALAYLATAELGGSGFIASFVAGLVFGRLRGREQAETVELTEEIGGVLSAVTFFVFAVVLAGPAIDGLDVTAVLYAVASLTVLRMLPVAIAMVGSRSSWQTDAFAGWFGPRGLATIVFALTVVESGDLAGSDTIVTIATIVVLVSVFAHGLTAPPLTERYVGWFERRRDELELETVEVATPVRRRAGVWAPRHRPAAPGGSSAAG
jgi:NhaP-type Na+/H+ or K+/H+ antiporter